MKSITLSFFMAIFLVMSLQRCNQDEVSSEVEKIQFAISLSSPDGSNGRIKVALPENTSVLLSIESVSGDPVFTMHPVKFISLNLLTSTRVVIRSPIFLWWNLQRNQLKTKSAGCRRVPHIMSLQLRATTIGCYFV